MKNTIFVVDDIAEIRALLRAFCERDGYHVEEAGSGEDFLKKLDALDACDAVILDIVLPGVDGYEVLARIREVHPQLPVIISTGLGDTDSILRCLRLGATDFITKPIDPTRLSASIANAVRARGLTSEVKRLTTALSSVVGIESIVGRSDAMRRVSELISRVKDSETTVLLLGESGTGKEVVARALHFQGHRAAAPFIAVNCAALPESLLESELFGYEAGAFTGAERTRAGKFEAAGPGTIFLDEIGEMSPDSQTRLLRVLQERRVSRLGGSNDIPIKARVVCATNRQLDQLVANGRFREDLWYRINAFPIPIPALRERREDIPALAHHFLRLYARQESRRINGFDPAAMEALERYHWPGNVRQLENAIERAVLLTEGDMITLDTLPDALQPQDEQLNVENFIDVGEGWQGQPAVPLGTSAVTTRIDRGRPPSSTTTGAIHFERAEDVLPLYRIERAAILAALQACGGDVQGTARRLEISRATIYRRLRRYGVDPDDHRA